MYTHPATAEQCLHNALKIVNAMRFAGIDYDIQVSSFNILLKHIYTGGTGFTPRWAGGGVLYFFLHLWARAQHLPFT